MSSRQYAHENKIQWLHLKELIVLLGALSPCVQCTKNVFQMEIAISQKFTSIEPFLLIPKQTIRKQRMYAHETVQA